MPRRLLSNADFAARQGLLCAAVATLLGRSAAVRCAAAVVMIVAAVAGAPATATAQEGSFSDVAEGSHKRAIDVLADRGIFEGTLCGEDRFCPGEPVSRSHMAVWLIRALGDSAVPSAGTTRFVDVDASEWWAPYVERLADLGITAGCRLEPLSYCPDASVSRAHMATFLVRALDLELAEPAGFADVVEGSAHEAAINALASAGITAGCSLEPLRYCPGDPVRRSHMAIFLARALGLLEGPTPATDAGHRMVAFGRDHSCWLMPDGNVQCWSVADGDELATPGGPFIAVTAGDGFTCGIRLRPGAVVCWGDSVAGTLQVPNGRFTSLAAGYDHVCAVRTDMALACWGASEAGQADPPEGQFRMVVAGAAYSCGLGLSGAVQCWGDNRFGQTDVPGGSYTDVAAGPAHGCAIRADGAAVCWGDSRFGQANAPSGDFTKIAAGLAHSCAIGTDGAVQCWGSNALGQTEVPEGGFTDIWAGLVETCALDADNNVVCWGAAA